MTEPGEDYVCSVCGSGDVQHAMWVRVNTDEVLDSFGGWDSSLYDNSWCEACGEHHRLISKAEYEERRTLGTPGIHL